MKLSFSSSVNFLKFIFLSSLYWYIMIRSIVYRHKVFNAGSLQSIVCGGSLVWLVGGPEVLQAWVQCKLHNLLTFVLYQHISRFQYQMSPDLSWLNLDHLKLHYPLYIQSISAMIIMWQFGLFNVKEYILPVCYMFIKITNKMLRKERV